jgi:hypothetical protein
MAASGWKKPSTASTSGCTDMTTEARLEQLQRDNAALRVYIAILSEQIERLNAQLQRLPVIEIPPDNEERQ